MVRDLFLPHEGARALSRALSGPRVIAMLSPIICAALVQWLGRPATLMATALFASPTAAPAAAAG